MSISLGLVGCGSFGRQFIGLFQNHLEVHRLALCDLNPDLLAQAAAQFQVTETYDSLDALCASDLDAVAIITQHWMHAPQACQAMRAGKHVYTAVPCAWRLEECDLLVDTVKQTGQIYMTGETSFFRKECAYLRQRAAAGDFGRIIHIEAEYLHDLDHGLREVAQRRHGANFDRSKTGGIPMQYPTHSVCFPVAITGSYVRSVSCAGFSLPNDDWWHGENGANTFCNETALMELADGSTARICEYRRIGHRGAERVSRVYGTEASWEWGMAGPIWCTKNGHEPVEPPADFEPLPALLARDKGGHGGSHAYLVNEFVTACATGRQPRLNVWQAVRYWAPGMVAHQSALRGGERLPVPDWGDPPV